MRLIDISPPVDATINVWPGDTPYSRIVSREIANGANVTLSSIRTTLHVGAHTDAPSHYTASGEHIAARKLEIYIGPCSVFHVPGTKGRRVLPADLKSRVITTPRVLMRTDSFHGHRMWNNDFSSLSPEVIDFLHEQGVILIGIDTPSVDPFESEALEAHQALARTDIANLEGLDLSHISEGDYELIALPLRLVGADASPVRAVLRVP